MCFFGKQVWLKISYTLGDMKLWEKKMHIILTQKYISKKLIVDNEQVAIKYEYFRLLASKQHQGWIAVNWRLGKDHIPRYQLQAPRKLTYN